MQNETNNENKKHKPHSEAFFGEVRDYWWNRDFLELMGKRLEFDKVQTVLDVGSGIGHWGQLLLPLLAPNALLTGVDREPEWMIRAQERARKNGFDHQCSYQLGDACELSFPDGMFDLVTCQTVLIHLKDPILALKEMMRVLKPGGILFVSEPNNQANGAIASSLSKNFSIDEIMDRRKFGLMCERGKEALGLGNISLGDLVPGFFAQLGMKEIRVYQNDKTNPLFAPYKTQEQQADIKQVADFAAKDSIGWDREEASSYFIAGGGTPDEFERYWSLTLKDMRTFLTSVENGAYHSAGGGVSYLISGRKSE
jgi:ubiquinone/menaquinone biosynthesis C-methylase UbiE